MKILSRNSYMWTGVWPDHRELVFRVPWLWWLDWKWLELKNWYSFELQCRNVQIKFNQAGGEGMSDGRWSRFLDFDLTTDEFLAMILCMGPREEDDPHQP